MGLIFQSWDLFHVTPLRLPSGFGVGKQGGPTQDHLHWQPISEELTPYLPDPQAGDAPKGKCRVKENGRPQGWAGQA
jgi:hypothetical protein